MMEFVITLLLICPKCGNAFTWSDFDFEATATCNRCGHRDEAWFFWHSTNPVAVVEDGGVKYEVWSYGAHYTNDALLSSYEEFLDQLLWRQKGMVHGGGPYMWIMRSWNGPDSPKLRYMVIIDEDYDGEKPVSSLLSEVSEKLTTGLEAVKSLPKSLFLLI